MEVQETPLGIYTDIVGCRKSTNLAILLTAHSQYHKEHSVKEFESEMTESEHIERCRQSHRRFRKAFHKANEAKVNLKQPAIMQELQLVLQGVANGNTACIYRVLVDIYRPFWDIVEEDLLAVLSDVLTSQKITTFEL